ncbi:hypothetical protein [Leuconostoc pseudomesenteroides]|uniref:hypothetical protein n=1 Tax=Leuconostoc pseudomesenteroides TaxID=33968 RepID=UPI0039EABC41
MAEKQIDDFKQSLSKNLFGKIVIKPDDLDRFKTILANMKKMTLQSQRNAEQISRELSKDKEQLADVKADHQYLKKTHQPLQDSQKIDYEM